MKIESKQYSGKLVSCSYRIELGDHYYTVKYVYNDNHGIQKEGWYVDGMFVTPMVDGIGSKMFEMAINVLQICLNARKSAGV